MVKSEFFETSTQVLKVLLVMSLMYKNHSVGKFRVYIENEKDLNSSARLMQKLNHPIFLIFLEFPSGKKLLFELT